MELVYTIEDFLVVYKRFNKYYVFYNYTTEDEFAEIPEEISIRLEKKVGDDFVEVDVIIAKYLFLTGIDINNDNIYRLVVEDFSYEIHYVYIRHFYNTLNRFITFVKKNLCSDCKCKGACNCNNSCLSEEAKHSLKIQELYSLTDYTFYNLTGLSDAEENGVAPLLLSINNLIQKYTKVFQSNLHNPNITLVSEISFYNFQVQTAIKYLILYHVEYHTFDQFGSLTGLTLHAKNTILKQITDFYQYDKIKHCIKKLGIDINEIKELVENFVDNPEWNGGEIPTPPITNHPPVQATNILIGTSYSPDFWIYANITKANFKTDYHDLEGDDIVAIKILSIQGASTNFEIISSGNPINVGDIIPMTDIAYSPLLVKGEANTVPLPIDPVKIQYQVADVGSGLFGATAYIDVIYPETPPAPVPSEYILINGNRFEYRPVPGNDGTSFVLGDIAMNGWIDQNTWGKVLSYTGSGDPTDSDNWDIVEYV